MMKRLVATSMLVGALFLLGHAEEANAQLSVSKIGRGTTGFPANKPVDGSLFGEALAPVGDLDNNGAEDLVVGAPGSESIWIVLLKTDDTVKNAIEISGISNQGDFFGASVASLGDLNGDGLVDLAVGAPGDPGGGMQRGAVWILFLDDGQGMTHFPFVKSCQRIDGTDLTALEDQDQFGRSVANLGDLDGNGDPDIAVGADLDDGTSPGRDRGAIWVIFLDIDTSALTVSVLASQEIDDSLTNLNLTDTELFGNSIVSFGDLLPTMSNDMDANTNDLDLAVGAPGWDRNQASGNNGNQGQVYVLQMSVDPTARTVALDSKFKVRASTTSIKIKANFGTALATVSDLDPPGTAAFDLLVGAKGAGCCSQRGFTGEVFVVRLEQQTENHNKIDLSNTLFDPIDVGDRFGSAIAVLAQGTGLPDVAVGAPRDDGPQSDCGETDIGAVWIIRNGSEVAGSPCQ